MQRITYKRTRDGWVAVRIENEKRRDLETISQDFNASRKRMRSCITPLGEFASVTEAAAAHNITSKVIRHRIQTVDGYSYSDIKPE